MSDEQTPENQPAEVVPVRSSVGHLLGLVEELIDEVRQARSLPLSHNALVDREKMLSRLETLLRGLPEELRAARWMVREREVFMRRAERAGLGDHQPGAVGVQASGQPVPHLGGGGCRSQCAGEKSRGGSPTDPIGSRGYSRRGFGVPGDPDR